MNPSLVPWGRRTASRLCGLLLAALTFIFTLPFTASAFPPVPNYTIYGLVRDQVGATLAVDGAEIILLRDNVEIGRAPIFKDLRLDSNYELNIRIDQQNAGTRTYSTKAVAPQGIYSLKIVMNGQNFFPIEASNTLRAGNGGERVRLDLSLGVDANNDGLPDAWQEWVLYQAGRRPGQAGWDINLVTKNGDFDGDGTSNFLEYVAGTFAGDATERFELRSPASPPPPWISRSTRSPAKSTASSKAPTSRRGRRCPSRSRPPARPSPSTKPPPPACCPFTPP
jgi:hypothetical protein